MVYTGIPSEEQHSDQGLVRLLPWTRDGRFVQSNVRKHDHAEGKVTEAELKWLV
jgi:hypothetical protein